MEFFETDVFTKRVQEILTDEEYGLLQACLLVRPDLGELIPGSGGLRKLRWSARGKGKRGGARVIYFWYVSRNQIYMLFAFRKSEQTGLSRDQLRRLKEFVKGIE